jgi:Tol biopolymer transport system component
MPTALITSSFQEVTPVLSPDGRFLAYVSNETGRYEVYLVPFPDVGRWRERVSVEGGREPLWSPEGSELFYRHSAAPDGDLMLVEVDTSGPRPSFQERLLFDASSYRANELHQRYSVSPDGQRFIFLRRPMGQNPTVVDEPTTLILNWFTELEERLGGKS